MTEGGSGLIPPLVLGLALCGAAARAADAPGPARLREWRDRLAAHLEQGILAFWLRHGPDEARGGFHGGLDRTGTPNPEADRSLVQLSRILWTFSAAYRWKADPAYARAADRAFAHLTGRFWDRRHGGWWWSVGADGRPKDRHKHLYGQSFALYGLAEYGRTFRNARALELARGTFRRLDRVAHDARHGGYREAWTEDWKPAAEHPIGPVGLKTANTHLHLLESFTVLLEAAGSPPVRARLEELRRICVTALVHPDGWTREFFEDDWTPKGDGTTSYGHDIELAWLLGAADAALGRRPDDPDTTAVRRALAAHTLQHGYDRTRGGIFERGPAGGAATVRSKTWWAQAEALVGFLDAYQLTRDPAYWSAFERTAEFCLTTVADREHGEWFPQLDASGRVEATWKASPWKGPYHNGRACLEVVRRLERLGS
jgi:mannobiose 2-epimerase